VVVTVGQGHKEIVAVVREVGTPVVELAGMKVVLFGSSVPAVEDSCPVSGSRIVAEGYCKHQLSVAVAVEDNS
jgi:hypothetical protein